MATRCRCPPLNSCGYLPKALPSRPTFSSSVRARCSRSARPLPMLWMTIGSTSVWPMVKRGFRLAYGFWNTIWMRRRMPWRSRSLSLSRFLPSKMTSPPVGSCRRSSVRPIVVLPEPDSPTTPSVCPLRSWKLTFCTALNSRLPNRPFFSQKLLARLRTSSTTGALASLTLAPCAASAAWPAALRLAAAMWSSITIRRAGLPSRLGRQASSARV